MTATRTPPKPPCAWPPLIPRPWRGGEPPDRAPATTGKPLTQEGTKAMADDTEHNQPSGAARIFGDFAPALVHFAKQVFGNN